MLVDDLKKTELKLESKCNLIISTTPADSASPPHWRTAFSSTKKEL
jgi:hypothetical protein